MAIHVPLYPFNLGDNDCYLFLIEDYSTKNGTVKWYSDSLIDDFGKIALDEVINNGLLVYSRSDESVRLSFEVVGTVPYKVKQFIGRELCTYQELLSRFPKNARCSSFKLKNILAYLSNFSQAQLVTLPSSAIPVIGADGVEGGPEHIETYLDLVYAFSDRIEPRFLHQMSALEGLDEFTKLC